MKKPTYGAKLLSVAPVSKLFLSCKTPPAGRAGEGAAAGIEQEGQRQEAGATWRCVALFVGLVCTSSGFDLGKPRPLQDEGSGETSPA